MIIDITRHHMTTSLHINFEVKPHGADKKWIEDDEWKHLVCGVDISDFHPGLARLVLARFDSQDVP